jgi:hypothetical protein
MAFANYLQTTDRTAPEEVVDNYAIGNMSFDDAIQLSQPIQVIDEVSCHRTDGRYVSYKRSCG